MDWNSVGIGASVLGVVLGLVFWLWPRQKPSAAASGGSSTIGRSAHVAGTVIVGHGNTIHNAPPSTPSGSTPAMSTQQRTVGTAGITLNQLSDLLKNATSFRHKNILKSYEGKTFMIRGRITALDIFGSCPALTVKHDNISANIYFTSSDEATFDYIHDESWNIEVEAILNNDVMIPSNESCMFFREPSSYNITPSNST